MLATGRHPLAILGVGPYAPLYGLVALDLVLDSLGLLLLRNRKVARKCLQCLQWT